MGRASSAAAVDERRDEEERVDLTPEQEEALLQAIGEDERDEVIPWEELRDQLRRR